MSTKPFTATLQLLQGGSFNDQVGEMLAETVLAVEETGKPGKLVITLDIKRSAGALAITAKATNKSPEAPPEADLLWSTVEGNLTTANPKQQALDLRSVEAPRGELRTA